MLNIDRHVLWLFIFTVVLAVVMKQQSSLLWNESTQVTVVRLLFPCFGIVLLLCELYERFKSQLGPVPPNPDMEARLRANSNHNTNSANTTANPAT